MLKKYTLLPLVLCLSGIAQAESIDNPWYIGARVGGTHFNKFEDSLHINKDNFKQNNVGGGAFIGYQFVPWFGIETGYTYLGEAKLEHGSGKFQVQGGDIVLKFNHSFNESFDIYSKLGGYGYHAKNTTNHLSDEKKSGFSSTAGLGLEFFFNDDSSMRLEYQFYNRIGKNKAGSADIHFYGLSMVYGWGGDLPILPTIAPPKPIPVPAPKITYIEPLRTSLPFSFNSDRLNTQYLAVLNPIGQRLKQYPQSKLVVIGHTDNRGSESYNLRLSEKRAKITAEYLAVHFNLNPNRIIIQGDGELRPITSNNTAQGRAENRRVEIYTPGFNVKE